MNQPCQFAATAPPGRALGPAPLRYGRRAFAGCYRAAATGSGWPGAGSPPIGSAFDNEQRP